MVRWNVGPHMARKGWTTAYRLAVESGIAQPAAARVLAGAPLRRVDVATLEALARAFGVEQKPWTLLAFAVETRR
jgi:transcriptional regulator with XRE-family HTH domain